MKKDTLNKIKKIFLEQSSQIKRKLAAESDEFDIDGDDVDQAAATVLCKVAQDLTNRQILQLKRIESALERIEDGSFGICEECGEDIAEKRLLAKPEATTCIVCAERLEYEAKQYVERE